MKQYSGIHSPTFYYYRQNFESKELELSGLDANKRKVLKEYMAWRTYSRYIEILKRSTVGKKGAEFYGVYTDSLDDIQYNGIKLEDWLKVVQAANNEAKIITDTVNEIVLQIEYIAYIMKEVGEEDYRNKLYSDIGTFSYSGEYTEAYEWCMKFVNAGLALPVYLIDKFNKDIKADYEKKETIDNIIKMIGAIEDVRVDLYKAIGNSELYLNKLVWDYVHDNFSNDKKIGMLILANTFINVYNTLNKSGKMDFKRLINSAKQEVLCVKGKNGERLATKREIKSIVGGVYRRDIYYVSDDKYRMLNALGWMVYGDDTYYKIAKLGFSKNEIDKLSISKEKLMDTLNWLSSDEFFDKDIPKLAKGLKGIEYPDSTEDDEIVIGPSIKDMVKEILEYCTNDGGYTSLGISIAKDAVKKKNYRLTEKQLAVIQNVYDKLVSRRNKEYGSNKLDEILKYMMLKIQNSPRVRNSDFVMKIIDSVIQYGKCSEKQEKVIIDEYNRLFSSNKTLEESINNSEVDSIDAIATDSEEQEILSGLNKGKGGSVEQAYAKRELTDEEILGLVDESDDIYENDSNIINNKVSIDVVNMSNILGNGIIGI